MGFAPGIVRDRPEGGVPTDQREDRYGTSG